MTTFLLYESASGYGLFEVTSLDEIGGSSVDAVQQAVTNLERFGKAVKLAAFKPFTSAINALEQINAVSESQVRQPGGPTTHSSIASSAHPAPCMQACSAAGTHAWRDCTGRMHPPAGHR